MVVFIINKERKKLVVFDKEKNQCSYSNHAAQKPRTDYARDCNFR
jgi:hypothetical protein